MNVNTLPSILTRWSVVVIVMYSGNSILNPFLSVSELFPSMLMCNEAGIFTSELYNAVTSVVMFLLSMLKEVLSFTVASNVPLGEIL
ncbi:unknown [Bacteroides sp. CAG:1076]|nr:unknown [Bacteroides sp. CAG:1076]